MFANKFTFLAITSCLIAACGTEPEATPDAAMMTVDEDMGTSDEGRSDDVAAPDVAVDLATPDFGPEIYPVRTESEPNTQPDQATPFTQPAVLTGSVDIDNDLFDWWEVDLAGPAILRITIQSEHAGWIEVQSPQASKRGLRGPAGTSREFFVPSANRYKVGILATDEMPRGEYRIEVVATEVSPTPLTDLTVTGDLEDGKVDVYSWTSAGAGFTVVEVFGQRAPVSSALDSFLFVYDDSLDDFHWNDDANSGGTKDSRLDFDRRDGAEYLFAVDMYEPTQDRRYELRIQPN